MAHMLQATVKGGFPQIIATEGQISLAGDRIEVRGSKHREDSMRPLWQKRVGTV